MEDNVEINSIPGTAQIRKLGASMTSMQLLQLSSKMAAEGLDKKLWSLLSRVYADKKSFDKRYEDGMEAYVDIILGADIPAELKLQAFTSFMLPDQFLPDYQTIKDMILGCDGKRLNIAGYFIVYYELEDLLYDVLIEKSEILQVLVAVIPQPRLIKLYERIFNSENKEVITGAIRLVEKGRKKLHYSSDDEIKGLVDLAFESKEVFFTSKLLFCMAFNVPESIVKGQRTLDKILTISINYEERTTKEFVKRYNLKFDISDTALCKYYLGNKKTANQKGIVYKFAAHLMRVSDPGDRRYLLRGAFKRGGYFRMYAGCMQDGFIDPVKMKKYHYSEEDVSWCATLPGLKK